MAAGLCTRERAAQAGLKPAADKLAGKAKQRSVLDNAIDFPERTGATAWDAAGLLARVDLLRHRGSRLGAAAEWIGRTMFAAANGGEAERVYTRESRRPRHD